MLKPRGLRHIALKTRKMKETERFYTKLLGMKVVMRGQGMLGLETPGGDDFWNFFATKKEFDPDAGGLDHFGLHFDKKEFARVREELAKAGVEITGRRGQWSVYVTDPNGYTVELHAD
jgi:catechol 2,3-dioxygenase-like lactoylglutathione lyase family enzyme